MKMQDMNNNKEEATHTVDDVMEVICWTSTMREKNLERCEANTHNPIMQKDFL